MTARITDEKNIYVTDAGFGALVIIDRDKARKLIGLYKAKR